MAIGSELARLRGTKTDIVERFLVIVVFHGVCDG